MKIKLTVLLLASLFFVQSSFAQGDPASNISNHSIQQNFTTQWEDDTDVNTHSVSTGTGTAISSVELELDVKVFPNPVSDVLQIKHEETGDMQIEIISFTGVISKRVFSKGGDTTVNLQDLIAGNYYVRIRVGNKTSIQKIIKLD